MPKQNSQKSIPSVASKNKGKKAEKLVQKEVEVVQEKRKRKGQSAEEKTKNKLVKVASSKNQNKAPTRKSLGLSQPGSAVRTPTAEIKKGKKKAESVVLDDSEEDESSTGDTVIYQGESTTGTPKSSTKRKKRVSIAWAQGILKMPSNEEKTLVSSLFFSSFPKELTGCLLIFCYIVGNENTARSECEVVHYPKPTRSNLLRKSCEKALQKQFSSGPRPFG